MKKVLIFAMLFSAASLLFSCGSDDPPTSDEVKEEEKNSSSSEGSFGQNYCVYHEAGICIRGSYSECPEGGFVNDACPYSSSSAGTVGISSSGEEGGGDDESSNSNGANCPSASGNVFVDQRDCKTYKYEIASNGRIWMSENLNYSRNNTLGFCYGVDIDGANPHQDAAGCNSGYGRIYEWAVAIDGNSPQGLCPSGWHIPTTAEWSTVIAGETAARKMSSGFYIYPGNYNLNSEYPPIGWKEKDKSGFYWTGSGNSYFTGFWNGPASNYSSSPFEEASSGAGSLEKFSVRCIAD